jgi:hypothetical protein
MAGGIWFAAEASDRHARKSIERLRRFQNASAAFASVLRAGCKIPILFPFSRNRRGDRVTWLVYPTIQATFLPALYGCHELNPQ